VVFGGALAALTAHCHGLLAAAAAGQRPLPGGFVPACGGAVAWHCVRLARAVAGPELRLRRALQRARRRGCGADPAASRRPAAGAPADCNELLATRPPRVAASAPANDARREGVQL